MMVKEETWARGGGGVQWGITGAYYPLYETFAREQWFTVSVSVIITSIYDKPLYLH